MLYADDAGIVSKSAESLAKMMAVISVTTISFKAAARCLRRRRRSCCCGHRTTGIHTLLRRSSWQQQARGINRQCSVCNWAVLSTKPPAQSNNHATDQTTSSRLAGACFHRLKLEELYYKQTAASLMVKLRMRESRLI